MVFLYWILVTIVLSAITGIFFTSFAVYIKKTKRKSDSIFWRSFYSGLIGGLLGSIMGFILGVIVSSSGDQLFLGLAAWGQAMVFFKVFTILWIICIILGAIIGGLQYLEKNNY